MSEPTTMQAANSSVEGTTVATDAATGHAAAGADSVPQSIAQADAFSIADAIGARVSDGGLVLWVLAGFSVVALAIVLVKLLQFARLKIWSRAWLDEVWHDLAKGPAATQKVLAGVREQANPVARVIEVVLAGRLAGVASEVELREEVERVAHEQLGQLESGLRGVESIGTLAPLLGLLGTVLGMIQAFAQLERAGHAVDPSILSGGIWEALLTTAVGLAVAIPAMAALAWLDAQVDGVRRQLGDAATRALGAAAWRQPGAPRPAAADLSESPAVIPGSEPQHAL